MGIPQTSAQIYLRHADALIGYATALVGPSDAEDAVADAMAGLLPKVDLAAIDNPRAYLFRCVLNQVRSSARRDRARLRRERLVGSRPRHRHEVVVDGDLGLLAGLSVRERAVTYLTYWEDLPVGEVATTLDIGEGSVRRYLARARAKLRTRLIEEQGDGQSPSPGLRNIERETRGSR